MDCVNWGFAIWWSVIWTTDCAARHPVPMRDWSRKQLENSVTAISARQHGPTWKPKTVACLSKPRPAMSGMSFWRVAYDQSNVTTSSLPIMLMIKSRRSF